MIHFLNAPARHLKIGVDLLSSTEIWNEMFTKFVEERMKAPEEKRIDFFASIRNSKIRTGLEKVKVKNNVIDVIKEDKNAFGILVGKVETPSEA